MLANATERTANLCGWLATLKNRIGCHEYDRSPKPTSTANLHRSEYTEQVGTIKGNRIL